MTKDNLITVGGAGGFIGGALVADLLRKGHTRIRAIDIKPFSEWYQKFEEVENLQLDLADLANCHVAAKGAHTIYNLAADMGGMGFIENNKALCMLSVLINTHLCMAAKDACVERFFYASSACVYNGDKQKEYDIPALKEADAYPALPEDGYGWEKLFSERMCRHFREDFGIATRVARYHNVYGPLGTWDGGREKAPAAICRKVALAKISGNHDIEIWGTGEQTCNFMCITDCVFGTQMLLNRGLVEPINIGSAEMVSIIQLVDLAEDIAGIKLNRLYNLSAPEGGTCRSNDNSLIKQYSTGSPAPVCATAWKSPASGFTIRSSKGPNRSEVSQLERI